MLNVAQNYCANSEKIFRGSEGWFCFGDGGVRWVIWSIYWVILINEFTDKIALIGPSPMTPTEVRAKIRALVLHVLLHAQCCMYFSTILWIRKNVKLEKKSMLNISFPLVDLQNGIQHWPIVTFIFLTFKVFRMRHLEMFPPLGSSVLEPYLREIIILRHIT